ncbi:hypothetical protein E8E13_009750 [Curvularia kusanoi]|uniref:Amidohydrolase-related domain-containing protein n=1 Tax=Curvularia kusanoi TaxID=90978 RepID=A0A9P4TET8_CURKU|nr:hypothetical protein E8E13_009750 [Curvularia kusanoi]
MGSHLKSITLEEHFTSKAADAQYGSVSMLYGPAIGAKLVDLTDDRLKNMDAGAVERQVLSHTPFPDAPSLELCTAINDEIATAVSAHPDRFSGFASLPMDKPEAAAAELRRAVTTLGFVGALVDTHTEGTFYDSPAYDVVWKTCCELDVPFYIHPCYASEEMLRVNYRSEAYSENVAKSLGAFVFGWHTETGLHFLRLFAAGVFDRFPTLKLVLGHMGECIPYMLARQELSTGRWSHLKRPLREVWDTNVWCTTSGMFTLLPLRCLLGVSKPERVLFSIDYPFSATEAGKDFIKEIETEGLLSGTGLEAFVRGNAATLLKL